MTDETNATGAEIVQRIATARRFDLSTADLTALGAALDQDHTAAIVAVAAAAALAAAAAAAAVSSATAAAEVAAAAETRLVKLEQQTRALADAVIAMTNGDMTVAPAVRLVKETM